MYKVTNARNEVLATGTRQGVVAWLVNNHYHAVHGFSVAAAGDSVGIWAQWAAGDSTVTVDVF